MPNLPLQHDLLLLLRKQFIVEGTQLLMKHNLCLSRLYKFPIPLNFLTNFIFHPIEFFIQLEVLSKISKERTTSVLVFPG